MRGHPRLTKAGNVSLQKHHWATAPEARDYIVPVTCLLDRRPWNCSSRGGVPSRAHKITMTRYVVDGGTALEHLRRTVPLGRDIAGRRDEDSEFLHRADSNAFSPLRYRRFKRGAVQIVL